MRKHVLLFLVLQQVTREKRIHKCELGKGG